MWIKWNKSHDLMIKQIFKRNEKITWCIKNAARIHIAKISLTLSPPADSMWKYTKHTNGTLMTHTVHSSWIHFSGIILLPFFIRFAFFCLCLFWSLHFFILNILSSVSSFGFLCAVWHSLLAGRVRARCCVVINFVCTQEIAVAFYFDLLCTQHETITMPS